VSGYPILVLMVYVLQLIQLVSLPSDVIVAAFPVCRVVFWFFHRSNSNVYPILEDSDFAKYLFQPIFTVLDGFGWFF